MAASIQTDPRFIFGTPRVLFEGDYFRATGRTYDVAPDGRFLMIKTGAQTDTARPRQITVVLNWTQELLERVPVACQVR